MKYLPHQGRWFSISHDHWQKAKSTLSNQTMVMIENEYNHEGDPEESKEHKFGNGDKWGGKSMFLWRENSNENVQT